MTHESRSELMKVLTELSECSPDVRLGQLVVNLAYMAKGPTNEAIWDVEDEELLIVAKRHLETLAQKHAATT